MKPRKNKPGGKAIYDESLKIAVARAYITGNLSFSQVAEKFKIAGGREVVGGFVKWYRKHYQEELLSTNTSPPNLNKDNNTEQQKRVKELEKELSHANLKIAALEIMIEIAEKELGIDIRKKPGTKQ